MSPTHDVLHIPPAYTLETNERNPRTADERMVVRIQDGRVLAGIQTLRDDLLPN